MIILTKKHGVKKRLNPLRLSGVFMKEKNVFKNVIIIFLSLLFGVFTGLLTLAAFFYRNQYPLDFIESYVDTFPDNPLINLGIVVLVGLVFGGLYYLMRRFEVKDKIVHIIAAVTSLVILAGLIIFVYKSRCIPVCDQMQLVLDAIFFKYGNYEDMRGYLNTFQQQYGLVFLEELMMYIREDFRLLQYLNAFFVAGCTYAMYHVTKELFQKPFISLISVILSASFVPLYFYTNFVYGEVPSLAFSMYGIWMLLLFLNNTGEKGKFINRKNWMFLVLTVFLFTLSYISRTNLVILLIAIVLAVCVYGIHEKKPLAFALAAVIIAVPLLVNSGIKRGYELRSGIKIGEPQPALGWIAMGLQVSDRGYGFCNDYANNTFTTVAGCDPEVAKNIYREEIAYQLQEKKISPGGFFTFYKMKMMQQWNEGTFGSIVSTNAFIDPVPGRTIGKIFSNVYGKYVNAFCDRYLAVIYTFFLFYAVYSLMYAVLGLVKGRNEDSGGVKLEYLLMIYFIGGFLFSLLWEAKPRYVFPYVYVSIPLAAFGVTRLLESVFGLVGKAGKRKTKEQISKDEGEEAE